MKQNQDHIDWSRTTWEGARREQLRQWRKLSLYEKLRALEEMEDLAGKFSKARERRGLSSIRPE